MSERNGYEIMGAQCSGVGRGVLGALLPPALNYVVFGATTWEPAPSLDDVRSGAGVLRRNMKGAAVVSLQSLLGGIAVDGEFGPATESAVKKFQDSQPGLGASGVVGADTLKALETRKLAFDRGEAQPESVTVIPRVSTPPSPSARTSSTPSYESSSALVPAQAPAPGISPIAGLPWSTVALAGIGAICFGTSIYLVLR